MNHSVESSVSSKEDKIQEWRQASVNALTDLKQSLALYHSQSSELTSTSEPFVANYNAKAVLERQLSEIADSLASFLEPGLTSSSHSGGK